MRNARLDEAQTGIKTAGRNINNLRYANDTTPITSLDIDGETVETVLTLFFGAPKSLQMVIASMK